MAHPQRDPGTHPEGTGRYVAVVGPADADTPLLAAASEVGARLAAAGATVVTGGLGGVMAAASAAASAAGGTTVGLLPGTSRRDAAPGVTVALPTGMGEGRNLLVVLAADVVISVGGSWGTLSEVALAHRLGVPVVTLNGWTVLDETGAHREPTSVRTPAEAVDRALRAAPSQID